MSVSAPGHSPRFDTVAISNPTTDVLEPRIAQIESGAAANIYAVLNLARAGESTIRLSIGIEDPSDIIADLERAFSAA